MEEIIYIWKFLKYDNQKFNQKHVFFIIWKIGRKEAYIANFIFKIKEKSPLLECLNMNYHKIIKKKKKVKAFSDWNI